MNDKHYSFNTVNTNTEPFKIKDFAINSIKCSVKDGSVFHNEIEIGRIEEVKKIDNEIKSLNFVTYDDIKDEEIRKCFPSHSTTYHFDNTKNSYEIQYGYTMTIDFTNSNEISDITFSLTRHQTSYRPVFLDNIYVGSIVNEQKDSDGNIIGGILEIQSGGIEKLSKFNHKILEFNENNKILTFKNEDNSLSNSIIVNTELRKVVLLDNFSSERKIPIHNLCCDYIDIGYIKESDIKENEFTINISKENILSNFSGFSAFNNENGFKVDKDIDYSIKYDENCIIGYERQLYYNYNLSCYNISNEINKTNIVIIPELKNRLINEYSFDTLSVRFTDTDINDFPYSNTIILSRLNNFENSYETDKGKMTIKFNEDNNLINIIVDFNSGPEWNEEYFWNIDSKEIESNIDKIIFKSQNIDINNPEPEFEVVNTEPEKVYNLEFGILEETNFEPFTLVVNSKDAKSIVVELPKNEYSDNVSQEFIIRFEIDTPTKMLVPLKFHNNETVEFGKLNKEYLKQIYLNTEDITTLLFNQLPSKGGVSHYTVQDLNNNLIDERFIKLNNDLINETNNRISNDTDLSNWIIKEEQIRYDNDLILSNQVDFLSSTLSTEIKDRYDNDLILSNQVEFLSDVLSTEIKDRYDNDLILSNEINYLSSLIDTKTSISSDDGLMLGLTIKRISEKDYHDLVIDGPIDNSTLYIVSSDIRDVYGERIINLQDPIELSDAVNKKYVDEKVGVLKDNIVDIFNSDSELSILLTDDSLSDFSIENIKKSLRLILTTLSK